MNAHLNNEAVFNLFMAIIDEPQANTVLKSAKFAHSGVRLNANDLKKLFD